jgi:Mn2+/Fe2+ NRAMP family transporter
MAFSVLVMFAIMAATAATLGVKGKTITSAAEAAQALEPIAGSASGYLFAAGFIGSGILAVPVLAASGSAGLAGLLDKGGSTAVRVARPTSTRCSWSAWWAGPS